MTPALNLQTIEAHPLGKPSDRLRYGMTPFMAVLYAHFVDLHGDTPDEPFAPQYKRLLAHLGRGGRGYVHDAIRGLVERGWIQPIRQYNRYAWQYRFVHPVMHFPSVPARDESK